jgi:hypothetical protein
MRAPAFARVPYVYSPFGRYKEKWVTNGYLTCVGVWLSRRTPEDAHP